MPGKRASSHIFSGKSTPSGLASSETKVAANWYTVLALFKSDPHHNLSSFTTRTSSQCVGCRPPQIPPPPVASPLQLHTWSS